MPGKLQYIITIPEANQIRKTTESATPSHLWTTLSDCWRRADGFGTVIVGDSLAPDHHAEEIRPHVGDDARPKTLAPGGQRSE